MRIPFSGSPGGGSDPLPYSCLENPMDRGAWQATVHGVTKSWTQLNQLGMHTCICIYTHTQIYLLFHNLYVSVIYLTKND